MVTVEEVQQALLDNLQASEVEVVDISGGCGASFEVYVVSSQFEGKRTLQRHQAVHAAIADLMKDIHALSIKKAKTPSEVAGG